MEAKKQGVQWNTKVQENKNAAVLLKLQLLNSQTPAINEEKKVGSSPIKRIAVDDIVVNKSVKLEHGLEASKVELNTEDNEEEEVMEEGDVKNEVKDEIEDEEESSSSDNESIPKVLIDQEHIAPNAIVPQPLDADEPADNVRLWEQGWKKRYYKNKFEVDENDVEFRRKYFILN